MTPSSSFCFVLGLLVCVGVTGTSGAGCAGVKCSDAFGKCLFDEERKLYTAFEVYRGANDAIDDFVMLSYSKDDENSFKGQEEKGWDVEETSEGVIIRLVSEDSLPNIFSASLGKNCGIKVYPLMVQQTESRPNQLLPVLPPSRTTEDMKSLASELTVFAKFSSPASVSLSFKVDSPDNLFVGMEMDARVQEFTSGESISFPAVDDEMINQDFELKFILYAKRFALNMEEVESLQELNLLLTRSYTDTETDTESDTDPVQECKAFSLVTRPARFLFTRDYDAVNTLLQSNKNDDLSTLSRIFNHEKFECHRISCPTFAQDSFSFGLELTDDSTTAEPNENLPAAILYPKTDAVKSDNSDAVFRDVYFEKGLLDSSHGTFGRCDNAKVYGGNVLVTPPVISNRYGLIVFGTDGQSLHSLDSATTVPDGPDGDQIRWHRFVKAQQVQYPYLEVDIEYMSVGHVDEVFSFVAQDGGNQIDVFVSDPKLGLDILLGKLKQLSQSETTAEPVHKANLKGTTKTKKGWKGVKLSKLFSGILKRQTSSASPSASDFESKDESTQESAQALFDALTEIQMAAVKQIAKAQDELTRQLNALGVKVKFHSLPTLFAYCRNAKDGMNAHLLRPLLPNLVNHIQIPQAEPNQYQHVLPKIPLPSLASGVNFNSFYFGDRHEEAVAELDESKTVEFIYKELQKEFLDVASKIISELETVYDGEPVVRTVTAQYSHGLFWGGGDLHCGTKLCKIPPKTKATISLPVMTTETALEPEPEPPRHDKQQDEDRNLQTDD
eukprot:GILJ01000498.1.p1 GENE.GILJ01000498.1~~GILJ01000498.1.p1  ORF type:complete len:782 (+),score=144.69 GILJ01000498.1:43-2388(+)